MNNVKLGDICNIINGYAFKSNEYCDEGIRVIRITNVQKGEIVDEDPRFYPILKIDSINKYLLEEGDLLISLTGNVGRVGLVSNCMLPAALNQRVACLRIKDNRLIKRFLYHRLNSNSFERDCIEASKGIAQKNLSTEWLKQYRISIPSLEVQKQIIKTLDTVSELLSLQKQQIVELDNLIKAIFYDMFGDPVNNEKRWEKKILSEFIDNKRDITYGIVQRGDHVNDGVPVIRIKDIIEDSFIESNMVKTKNDISNKYSRTILQGGEILLSIRGTIGKVAIAPPRTKGWNISREVAIIPLEGKINDIFLLNLLRSEPIHDLFKDYVKGIAQRGMNLSDIRKIEIIYPPFSLQDKFATIATKIEAQKSLVKKSIEETQLLFDSLMSQYFDE